MSRYFFSWTPLIVVGTVTLLALPWLGLIALMVFGLAALAAFAALAVAIVALPYMAGRAISRRWQGRSVTRQPVAALSLVEREPR
jgi:hypothetical protein